MHILIISHYQDDGSISASFVEDQAMAYLDLGHDVTMISPVVIGKHYRNKPPQKKIYKGLTVYYPRYFSASKYGEYNINVFFGYSSVGRLFRKLAREKYFDIIHAHTIGFDGAVAVKLKKKYGIPAIITTHGTDTIGEIKKGNGEKLIPICNEADAVIAVSTKLKRLLLALEPSLNVSVIPNGYLAIDTEDKKINKKPYTLLQVSGLIPQKNVDITIKAFSNIIKKIPNAELVIIGSGPLRDELESLCAKLDVDSHVTFMGQVSNEEVLHVMAKSLVWMKA